jgi:hypothetical protein
MDHTRRDPARSAAHLGLEDLRCPALNSPWSAAVRAVRAVQGSTHVKYSVHRRRKKRDRQRACADRPCRACTREDCTAGSGRERAAREGTPATDSGHVNEPGTDLEGANQRAHGGRDERQDTQGPQGTRRA